jgi:HD-like signal output (HDOD) protein
MDQQLLDIIEQSAAVPTMPQVVTRFIEISADPDYKADELVEVLSVDPGITSELLRLTNSPLFGLSRKVSSLKQAVTLLGMNRVRTLVLGRYLVGRMQGILREPGNFSLSYYWRRSLTQAVLASRLADHLAPQYREEAFIASLLSDSGVVVMAQAIPERYESILSEYAPLRGQNLDQMERDLFGITHAEVSALVLEKWMLPQLVVGAVRRHHDSDLELPTSTERQLPLIVAAANNVAKLLCEKPDRANVVQYCQQAIEKLGIDVAGLARVLDQMQNDINQFADLLGVGIITSHIYERVIEMVQKELSAQAVAT